MNIHLLIYVYKLCVSDFISDTIRSRESACKSVTPRYYEF